MMMEEMRITLSSIRGWLLVAAMVLLSTASMSKASGVIRPGAIWRDNRGRIIQAHGGCILRLGHIFYLFGEDHPRHSNPKKRYVDCYRSTDLVHWIFCNKVVQLADPDHLGKTWILQRPKVFYNKRTHKYVMYAHIDGRGYSYASVAVFVCNTIDGNYRYIKSFRPLGHQSRDIGEYTGTNGKAYLLFEDRPSGFRIVQLSRNYLSVKKNICLIPYHLEGLGLVHYHGLYYVMGSHLTGWRSNPNVYATAKSLAGPWSKFRNIAPPGTNTYNSQSGFLLKIVGTKSTTIIYMGDRWTPPDLWNSRYIWMPLHIGDGRVRLPRPAPWIINLKTGIARILERP
ncbi:MAG: family 43 glycosylhydrolase [Phycisphaerae bacterium]